jgi:hypothetical protein
VFIYRSYRFDFAAGGASAAMVLLCVSVAGIHGDIFFHHQHLVLGGDQYSVNALSMATTRPGL